MHDIILTNIRPSAQLSPARSTTAPVAGPVGRTAPVAGTSLPRVANPGFNVTELPDLERLAEGLADFAASINRELMFRVHEASGRMVITVLDGETQQVVRQIPNEEFLRIAETLADARAQLFDVEV